MNLEFFRRVFEKCSNLKFPENPFNGSRVASSERTDRRMDWQAERQTGTQDRHEEDISHFTQFCQRAE
jgi:hypothetical protein